MKTTFCIPTLKKINSYKLEADRVSFKNYKKPYIIYVSEKNTEAIIKAYTYACEINKKDAQGYDSIFIEFENGEYRIDKTISFNKSAASGLPIVFHAEQKASLYASIKLKGNWTPYKNGIYRVPLKAAQFRQLYVNNAPAVRARFPKKNNDCSKEVFDGKWLDKTKQLYLTDNFAEALTEFDTKSGEIHIIEAWTHSVMKPESCKNIKKGFIVNLSPVCKNRFFEPRSSKIPNPKVWLENNLSLLSSPNEWFYDIENHMLYYYPDNERLINDLCFEIPQCETLIDISCCQNIRFENIDFCCTNWNKPSQTGYVDGQGVSRLDTIDGITAWRTPPAAVNICKSSAVQFINCTVFGTGAMGIKYDGECNDILLYRNRFYNIGAGAISVGSFIVEKPFKSPVSENVTISDNIVKNFGQSYLSGVGILVGYSRNVTIEHNDVSFGNYTGISVGWGWGLETPMSRCKIRGNRVTHIIENHLYDGAGLYILGRHQTNSKNIVSGNYLQGGHGYAGLYFDEKANNYTAENNYIGRGKKWFLLMHDIDYGLHDICIKNNFIEISKKYINSYSPNLKYKPISKSKRNIRFTENVCAIHPDWQKNKERIFNNSGIRKA